MTWSYKASSEVLIKLLDMFEGLILIPYPAVKYLFVCLEY